MISDIEDIKKMLISDKMIITSNVDKMKKVVDEQISDRLHYESKQ
jgi:hypothetical protein